MVDPERLYVWAWDARPYPAFPLHQDVWADHSSWHYGHWLNGRLGNPTVGEVINAILTDHGLPRAIVSEADGSVQGYVIEDPGTARGALEPLVDLFGLSVLETADGIEFQSRMARQPVAIAEMVADGDAVLEKVRSPDYRLPSEAVLSFRDPLLEHQVVSVRSTGIGGSGRNQHAIGFPGVFEAGQGRALAGDWLHRFRSAREQVSFALPQPNADVTPGAVIRLPGSVNDYLVTDIEDGLVRRVSASLLVNGMPKIWHSANPGAVSELPLVVGQPLALFMDLPMGAAEGGAEEQFRVAAWQKPWKSQVVFASPESTGFTQRATLARAADIGELAQPLRPGAVGRIDRSVVLEVTLRNGAFASTSRTLLLNGANRVAVLSANGEWEIVQFEQAEEVAPGLWQLKSLLRGQSGTDDALLAGAQSGAPVVVMDDRVRPAGLLAVEVGLELNWRVGPAGSDISDANFSSHVGVGGRRALMPLSPVHLRARVQGGDIRFSWIRRGRIDADSWTASDIPLGEEREEYQVQIASVSGAILRTETTPTPDYIYAAEDIATDVGVMPDGIAITVRQQSLVAGWGLPATRLFSFS